MTHVGINRYTVIEISILVHGIKVNGIFFFFSIEVKGITLAMVPAYCPLPLGYTVCRYSDCFLIDLSTLTQEKKKGGLLGAVQDKG